MLRHSFIRLLSLLAIVLMAASCRSVDKFVQPDERVLNHNVFQIQMADSSEVPSEINEALSDMKKYVKQKPNSHVLGKGPRLSMYIYCLSNPDKDNFWHRYLRRKGQAPVIFDESLTAQTCNQLTSLLNAKGCFNSQVTYDTVWQHSHDLDVIYLITPHPRYRISNVSFRAETPQVDSLLRLWRNESLLRSNGYYDQELLTKERTRIIERLRSEGYYLATTDLVSFTVDSAFEDDRLTIRMNIRDVVTPNGIRPLQKYHIDDIFIYPDATTSVLGSAPHFDTLVYHMQFRRSFADYKFLYSRPMSIKPQTISRSLMFFHGQTFRPSAIERTYNSLLGLHNFKYINIDLVESPNSSDSNRLLNARIRLMNTKRQRLSLSVEINNSSPFGENRSESLSGNMGLETKVSYQNKNLFGGAELFNTEWSLLVELPKLIIKNRSEELRNNVSSFENGLNFSLDLPTFLFPFTKNVQWQRMRPHTVFSFGANYQLHSYFERLLFNTGFGYNWQRRYNHHQLMPLELTFVRFFNIDSSFRNRISHTDDARIKYQYSDHFIMNTRYDYIYNTQQFGTRNNFNYIHLTVETAGNLLNLLSLISGNNTNEDGVMKVFGVPFSQYIKLNAELKRYFYVGTKSTLVARIIMGVGLPYGNSQSMPYEKSFFGGGPTTIRAWNLRHLGPGTFQPSTKYTFERIGDIQLVANLEYRFPIISIFEGALFTDAGNVWLVNESEEFPGGKFSFKNLPQSIASCVGLGLRANISIVTIRCDLALPVYDPGMESGLRLRPKHWKLSDITLNFGIDYPF